MKIKSETLTIHKSSLSQYDFGSWSMKNSEQNKFWAEAPYGGEFINKQNTKSTIL